MKRSDVLELHYITAVGNVVSILERGILSHAAAARLSHVSVASVEVQHRRAERRIPGGLRLHDYANLYFNARNAMLFRLIHNYVAAERIPPENLAVLRVSPGVLEMPGVVVTDINAAADVAPRWYSVVEGLPVLRRQEVYAQSWDHPDPEEKRRRMQRMMAEALVPRRVPPRFVLGAYAVSRPAATALTHLAPTLAVQVEPSMFFRCGER